MAPGTVLGVETKRKPVEKGEPLLPAKILPNQRPKPELTALRQLAASLPAGPLRAAIERLARRCG